MTEARFVELRCGARVLRVDASLCEMATERVFWREFLAGGGASGAPGAAVEVARAGALGPPSPHGESARASGAGEAPAHARGESRSGEATSDARGERERPGDSGTTSREARSQGEARSQAPHREPPLPALVVERAALPDAQLIHAPLGECRFERRGDTLRVDIADGVSRGELVLRLAYYLCAVEQGAVLIHACAVRHGDVAAVASGKSGDGKSTLSRLSVGAGLTLLTDEVVMLFPDGQVCGTPFRSDYAHAGAPGLTRARYFFALRKAPYEALEPLSALAAAQLATSQCFELPEVALPRTEARRRLLSFLAHVEPRTLAFRRAPAAGDFVRAALAEPAVTRL